MDDQYLSKINRLIIHRNIQMILQGHVSNDPIFPTDESTKLYGIFFV